MSAKNVVNVGEVTSHIRADSTLDIIASIPLSPHIIANGDTFSFIIRLEKQTHALLYYFDLLHFQAHL